MMIGDKHEELPLGFDYLKDMGNCKESDLRRVIAMKIGCLYLGFVKTMRKR